MAKELNIIVADDEPLVRETIKAYLEELKWPKIIGEARNGKEVIDILHTEKADLLLLDINMPELNGFETLGNLPSNARPMVIFITAYDEFALKAFEMNAIDYLLKPINIERLESALSKALTFKLGRREDSQFASLEKLVADINELKAQAAGASKFLKRILVKEQKKYFFVNVDEIVYFEASGDYVLLHKDKSKHFLNDSLSGLEERLDPHVFVRIHRSTIVNINCIQSFQPYFNGEFHITLKNGVQVKLSRNYKENLRTFFDSDNL